MCTGQLFITHDSLFTVFVVASISSTISASRWLLWHQVRKIKTSGVDALAEYIVKAFQVFRDIKNVNFVKPIEIEDSLEYSQRTWEIISGGGERKVTRAHGCLL